MNMVLISVIVPVYNVESYIAQCIESIQKQSYRNLEILLVDDGSTDNSGKICDLFAESDQRIKVIHQKNSGVMSARRRGLKKANGKYIGFVDGDDYIEPYMFEKLIKEILRTDADFVHCGYIINGQIEVPIKKVIIDFFDDKMNFIKNAVLGTECYISPSIWSKLFKADLIRKSFSYIPDTCVFGEDLANLCICILECNKAIFLNEAFYYYRVRENSLSHKNPIKSVKSIVKLHDDLCSILLPYDKNRNLERMLDEYLWWNLIENMGKLSPCNFQIAKYYYPNLTELQGKNIVIYGAGRVGRDYYSQISRCSNCTIVAWIDHQPEKYYYPYIELYGLEKLMTVEFDLLLIAVEKEKLAYMIYTRLILKGIDEGKIYWIKPDVYKLNNSYRI